MRTNQSLPFTIVALILIACQAAGQTACNAAAFGPVTQDPITISGSWTIGDACTLNFGARHVILDPTASLSVTHATLLSGQFTMQVGSVISSSPTVIGAMTIIALGGNGATGDVTIGGSIYVPSSSDWQGGAITIAAFGSFLMTGAAARLDVSGIATGTPGGSGGAITVTAGWSLTMGQGSILDASGQFSHGGSISLHSGGPLQLGGWVLAAALCHNLYGCTAAGGSVTITTLGNCLIQGFVNVSGSGDVCDDEGPQGTISIVASGDIAVPGGLAAYGWAQGTPTVSLDSLHGDISVAGGVGASSVSHGFAGWIHLTAARDVVVSGMIEADNEMGGCTPAQGGGGAILTAGREVLVDGTVRANGGNWGGTIALNGCKVRLSPTGVLSANFQLGFFDPTGGTITATAGDEMLIQGTITALEPISQLTGSVTLATRLASPYSPLLAGSTITPAPTILHDPTLAPCLANGLASLSGPPLLMPGATYTLNLQSVPNSPVVVVGALSLQYLSLGALGWTQLNPFTAPAIFADPGAFGPPIPGSATDASGHWGCAHSTAGIPGLSGMTVYAEAFVIDPNAANGLFHQPPYLATQFQ